MNSKYCLKWFLFFRHLFLHSFSYFTMDQYQLLQSCSWMMLCAWSSSLSMISWPSVIQRLFSQIVYFTGIVIHTQSLPIVSVYHCFVVAMDWMSDQSMIIHPSMPYAQQLNWKWLQSQLVCFEVGWIFLSSGNMVAKRRTLIGLGGCLTSES